MIKITKKLFIFLKTSNKDVKFNISPEGNLLEKDDNTYLYENVINLNQRNTTKVELLSKPTSEDYLQIQKIKLNDIDLNHLDCFSIYVTLNGVKRTYGWMDEIGTYKINLHTNAVSQNLLTYLISTEGD